MELNGKLCIEGKFMFNSVDNLLTYGNVLPLKLMQDVEKRVPRGFAYDKRLSVINFLGYKMLET